MGVNEQFLFRHKRSRPFGGSGFGNFLKGAAKKGWQFIKNEGKSFGNKLLESGKDYVEGELKSAGRDFVDKTGNKIRSGVKDIVKESAGPLAESILKNPSATREILQDSFRNASNKSKKLFNEIRDDTTSFASEQGSNIKDRGGISLSDALSSTKIGKKMKGKGKASSDGELTKPKPASRKRLTTIVPINNTPQRMPMYGDGASYIGQQYAMRGNGARVIGGQH